MDANEVKVPLEKAIRVYGVNKLCRETGVSYSTVRAVMKGIQTPTTPTAEKIAGGLEVGVDDLIWPLGFGEAYAERLYTREQFEAAVERRAAELVAQQAMGDEHTTNQEG